VKNRKPVALKTKLENSKTFYEATHKGAFKTYSKCKFKDAPKYAKHWQIT